jgi:predicted nicotinamide N-methyase
VELGCGLGLVSITAALLGAQAVATDGDSDVLAVAKKSMKHNAHGKTLHPIKTSLLSWGDPCHLQQLSEVVSLPADVIVMSDVIYGSDPGVWQKLLRTLEAISGPSTLILQAETHRPEGVLFHLYWDELEAKQYKRVEIPALLHGCPGVTEERCRLWAVTRASLDPSTHAS